MLLPHLPDVPCLLESCDRHNKVPRNGVASLGTEVKRVWGCIPVIGASPALLTQEGQGVAPSVWRKAAGRMAGRAVRHQKLPSNLPVFPEASVPLNCACRAPFARSRHGERGSIRWCDPFPSLLLLQGKRVIHFYQTLTWFCTWARGALLPQQLL